MDGFEKHIRNNKEQFDDHRADRDKMWKHIQAGINEKKIEKARIIPLWKRGWFMGAASLILLVGIGIGMLFSDISNSDFTTDATELLEIDVYYENLFAQQVKILQDSPELTDEEKEEFLQFIFEMEDEYKSLLKELEAELDNEKVLGAIVDHYQKGIEIVQSLLNRINESKIDKNDKGILL